MVQRYLIAVDLDGTLLTDDKRISTYTKLTLQKLIELGHYVVIATGRSNRMSILYYDELGLKTPLINSNGAFIHHPTNRNWGTYHHPLDLKTAKDIVEISCKTAMVACVATASVSIAKFMSDVKK